MADTRYTQTIAFFDAKPYDQLSFDRVNERYGFQMNYFENHLNAVTAGMATGAPIVCAFVNDTIDSAVIDALYRNKVELIALRCAGYNNVDFKAAFGKIHVVRVPAYSPYAVAEHAWALLLSLNRKTHRAYYRTRDGNFSINGFLGIDLHGKTAGVVGTGKIGRCFIAIAQGFGMKVVAYDPLPDAAYAKESGIRYVDLPTVYAQADVISLHCPLTPQTQYLINATSIAQMKASVIIINTGRGKLINTRDLIEGLKTERVGAAGLDVYEEESDYFFEDFSSVGVNDDVLARLLTFPNVLVTSHQGFFTQEALENIAITTFDNIAEYIDGGFLKNEICYRCNDGCKKKQGSRCFK